ncbi:MAG: Crp/Fnr family transcriptional regulator, partial [Muribaculaceae bacterium]|nr:Crp/Fnr family transcriptional regulator [Muribaculaceae bacterium]
MKTNKDNEGSIFTILRELPLIKGVSQTRLQQVAGHVPLHFIKYADGDEIAVAGQECTHLKFIVSGSVRVE